MRVVDDGSDSRQVVTLPSSTVTGSETAEVSPVLSVSVPVI
jgi:hypothetical protein